MGIYITSKVSRNKEKKWYTFEWGKNPDQRKAANVFTYVTCRNQIERNHNKEALALLETKKSQLILEHQSIGTPYIPTHRFYPNFLDYYSEFVKEHKLEGNRRLECSLAQFRKFLGKDFLSPKEVNEKLCVRYQKHLLQRLTGDTPLNYFAAFKRMMKAATKEGYFRTSPTEEVKSKKNPSKHLKEFLDSNEYVKMMSTPYCNKNIMEAFVVSCYTALRWCDVNALKWEDIDGESLTTKIIQKKTNKPLILALHPIVKSILEKKKAALSVEEQTGRVFSLGTANGCNKALKKWMKDAGIKKHITWHCARLSFSILLQDANVDLASVALMLGHTTTKYVNETYKRHRAENQTAHLNKLPQYVW